MSITIQGTSLTEEKPEEVIVTSPVMSQFKESEEETEVWIKSID